MTKKTINNRIHVAPMMNWTDKHGRYLMSLLSPQLRLWSEMKTANAIIHGNPALLESEAAEGVVLQLGGCEPAALARAAKKGEAAGYAAINLNMGCPSCRVGAGGFGAALMTTLDKAAACVEAMVAAVSVPINVKCRIGVDEQEPAEVLPTVLEKLAAVGVRDFAIHARKAWLQGVSPRQNRMLPPLNYQLVYDMKKTFPHLNFIINGGIETLAQAQQHLDFVDGVMMGRAAFRNPYMFAALEAEPLSRCAVLEQFTAYALREGLSAHHLTHYVSGLWTAERGAAYFRRRLNGIGELTPRTASALLNWTHARAA